MGKRTLVFGASPNPSRYSYYAVIKLLSQGNQTEAFGNKKGYINGVEIQTDLMPFKDIDTITLYLSPKHQKMYYDYIISLKPNRVIFNPGTENPEFYNLLRQRGMKYEVACTLTLLSTNQY